MWESPTPNIIEPFKGVRNNSFTPLGQEVNVDTVGDDKSNTIYSLVVKI